MHAIHPVGSPVLWLRVLAAIILVVIVPGYLLAGRHLAGGWVARLIASLSCGLLGSALVARLFDLAGIALHPWTILPAIALLGLGLGRWPSWRLLWRQVGSSMRPSERRESLALTAVALCWLIVLVVGYGDAVVPPTVDDAGNHAFLVSRIAGTASLDPEQIFAAPLGSIRVGYLVGWHVAAAQVARTAGVAPYVATWLLVLVLLAMFPLALSLLWRAFHVPAALVVLGAVWLLTDAFVPGGILGWGGFGQLVGMALVPLLSLLVATCLRERSWLASVVTGVALGAMIHVHASEVVVALGLGSLIHVVRPRDATTATTGRRAWWSAASVCCLALVLAAGPEVWALALTYHADVTPGVAGARREFGDALHRLLDAVGGPDFRHAAVLLGMGFGLADRRLRSLAVTSLVFGLFYLAVAVLKDPVSVALSSPFYAHAPRILYLQMYVLPPLLGLPLLAAWSPRIPHRWRRPTGILALTLTVSWFGLGLHRTVRDFRSQSNSVPFVAESYEHAVQLGTIVQPGEVIANLSRDGGAWALQVSGTEGVLPHGWNRVLADGSRLRDAVQDLAREPWAESAATLRGAGVVYLYVNDFVDAMAGGDQLHRADLDRDPRFDTVLVGDCSTLYRIRWLEP